ncbi:hyperosmolality-gated Ca2+ permeable channel 2.3 [Wolffia australiana]
MILAALFTSVGINLGLCVLFFVLYSILRNQPENAEVYAPRVVAEGKERRTTAFDLERLLPSTGWAKAAWNLSEDDLLSIAGLDAVIFMRIFVFSLKVFSFAGVIGVFILLPINYEGDQLHSIDLANLPNESLDKFTISNVKDGSNWLWVHFSAAYVMTAVVCYLLYLEYDYVCSKRMLYFYASKPQPHHFTVLVRGIPRSREGSYSESVEKFFSDIHASSYLTHIMVRQTSKLRRLIVDAESMYKKLTRLKSLRNERQRFSSGGFLRLFSQNDTSVEKCEKQLETLEENLRIQRSGASSVGQEVPAAFVFFRSRFSAATAIRIQQSLNPIEWVTEQAPEPRDVYWPFFSSSFTKRWISKLIVILASVVLTILFLIPVAFVQGLANLDRLEILFPFLKSVLTLTFVSQVITGYLPSLILYAFLSMVPPVMKVFSNMQGYISHSESEKSACSKMMLFTVWNAFFAVVLSGSVASQAEVFLDPRHIPERLAVAVPAQATFFITYVVTSGWTNLSYEVTRAKPLVKDFLRRHWWNFLGGELEVPSLPYHREIPSILFFWLLGSTYFFQAPLILPFVIIYFLMGFIVYRNQLLNVYKPKYETAGKYWPMVHNAAIISLVLMQLIAIGIFGLKKLPTASTLTIPLPVLTLLFNEYCRKRFLPNFQNYPAESLIKKDREEQNDPAMPDFLYNLASSYRDPAMKPTRLAAETEPGLSTDLLSLQQRLEID